MTYLFYVRDSDNIQSIVPPIPDDLYSVELWRPNSTSIMPDGFSKLPFAVWWLMHRFRVFSNREYSIFSIYHGATLVHRSCVFPRYFRFPFMATDDLQIGDTWTAEEHRGKGIATFAIKKLLELKQKPGRRFWYVTEEDNISSSRVVEKAGFVQVGKGQKCDRLGIGLIGSYMMEV